MHIIIVVSSDQSWGWVWRFHRNLRMVTHQKICNVEAFLEKKGWALGQGYIRAWIILLATNNEILSVVSLRSFWGRHYEQWVCTSGSDSSSQSSLGCFQPFVVCGKGVRLSRWQESTPTPESSLDFHFSKKGGSRVSLWSTHPHQPSIIVTFMLFWKTLSYLARSHHVI